MVKFLEISIFDVLLQDSKNIWSVIKKLEIT